MGLAVPRVAHISVCARFSRRTLLIKEELLLALKVPFAREMARAARLHPGMMDFIPRTWVLPDDGPVLARELESRPRRVIVKPDAGSQGDGIFIADSWADIRLRTTCSNRPFIAQQYISSPLTLHGLKFDIRVYVLISSLHPLKVHICREGLVRVATTPYREAGSRILTAHLTNYSLNVRDAAFEHNDDPTDGMPILVSTRDCTSLKQ